MTIDSTSAWPTKPDSYAAIGLAVFPCHSVRGDGKCTCTSPTKTECSSPGKHPRTKNGLKNATTDAKQIDIWWKRYPDANLAIATGRVSGIVVVDIDPRHGGDRTLVALESELGPLPKDWSVETGGGGIHVYLSYPNDKEIKSRNGWREGIDIKADGGYVIAPPSIHESGDQYEWTSRIQVTPPQIPSRWLSAVVESNESPIIDWTTTADAQSVLLQRAQQYAAKVAGVAEGERNDAAFGLAGNLAALQTEVGDRLGECDILGVVSSWNARCNPPLPEHELESCVSSALRNGKPRATKVVKASSGTKSQGDASEGAVEKRLSIADKIVELALNRYRLGQTETDEAFAVEIDGPNVAIMFRGSRDALRSALARAYRRAYGRTPNGTAIADALTTLQGEAHAGEPEPVHLRVAEHDGGIVIDIGDSSGRAVVVSTGGWQVVDRSPVLFRRTAATGRLALPERGGSLDKLRTLLNVTDETWPLVVGWLIAAFIPNMPHPILMLGGQQGTGKTSAAKKLVGVIDPSPADVRSQPRDAENWAISASASWVVAVDNVSHISDWWSDSLCKAVTGDGWLRRKLYTDGDLAVLSFRRVVLLTSIDAGALRGDLGDRVLLVDMELIDETKRRAERVIDREYEAARPQIFGALLDLVAKVWAELPHVQMDRLPRMADFGRLLAALDAVTNDESDGPCSQALKIYIGQKERIAESVIESDCVALSIADLIDKFGKWEGTAAQLLAQISPEKNSKDWPGTPQAIGGRLKRLTPALEQIGIAVSNDRTGRKRMIYLSRKNSQQVVTNVTWSQPSEIEGVFSDDLVTSGDECDNQPDPLGTTENAEFPEENGTCDKSDECGEQLQPISTGSEWIDV